MTKEQLQEELSLVNEAIHKIYAGAQSYSIGARSVTRANLESLLDERRRLESELAELETGGGRTIAAWPGR